MAVELEKFIQEQLTELPTDHSDRPFLLSVQTQVSKHLDNVDHKAQTEIFIDQASALSLEYNDRKTTQSRMFNALLRMHYGRELNSLSDLGVLSDKQLLRRRGIGHKMVGIIRRHYPHQPDSNL